MKGITWGERMIDTNKYEGHTCKWCGYVEDTHAWHYEECPIFDDPMMKHHIAEVKRLREQIESLRSLGMGKDGIEASGWDSLNAEVKRLRFELDEYEKYDICHPDGLYCCDECLERNGFEVAKDE